MRNLLFALMIFIGVRGAAFAQPTQANLDSFICSGGTTCLSTTSGNGHINAGAGDTVVICATVGTHGGTAPTVTIAGSGLTWATEANVLNTPVTGSANGFANRLMCFSALTAAPLTNTDATITSSTTLDDVSGIIFSVSGASAAVYDSNVSLPGTVAYADTTTATTISSATVSTSQANDLIVYFGATTGNGGCGTGATFGVTTMTHLISVVNGGGTAFSCIDGSKLAVTATQSSLSSASTGSGNSLKDWSSIIIAFTADTPATGRSRLIQ